MKINLTRPLSLSLMLALVLFTPKARAVTLGDAVLTVAISTAAGAVLGASTLPFYEQSSEHTKNIFYGAAIGAVVGVFTTAYMGVQDGPGEEEEALLRLRPSMPKHAEDWLLRDKVWASRSANLVSNQKSGPDLLLWSPLAKVDF